MIKNILMICIGNICRSPVAEALLLRKVADTNKQVHVHSAGLGALVGYPADPIAVTLMQERGIDLSSHRARQVTPDLLFAADLVLTMTTGQRERIEGTMPSMRGRVERLGKWGDFDIPDPFKRPRIAFEHAIMLIEQGVDAWYRTLSND